MQQIVKGLIGHPVQIKDHCKHLAGVRLDIFPPEIRDPVYNREVSVLQLLERLFKGVLKKDPVMAMGAVVVLPVPNRVCLIFSRRLIFLLYKAFAQAKNITIYIYGAHLMSIPELYDIIQHK